MKLIDAILPTLIDAGGVTFEVRPPVVREALVLLFVAPDALLGEEESIVAARNILAAWLPPKLYAKLDRQTVEKTIKDVIGILNAGIEDDAKAKKKTASEIVWEDVIASFMVMYRYSFDEVLALSWPAFLMLSKQIRRISALRKLDQLHVSNIPNIANDSDRKAAVIELRSAAGLHEFETVSDEEALSNLNALAVEYSMFTGAPIPKPESQEDSFDSPIGEEESP